MSELGIEPQQRTRQEPAQLPAEGSADVTASPDVVLAQGVNANERAGANAQRLLDTAPLGGEPALPPVAAGTDLNAVYALGTPADQDGDPPTAADAIRNAQDQRAAIDAMGRRAGADTSSGTGRMDPATITRRADHISWSLQNNQPVQGPNGQVDIRMSAEERAGMQSPDADTRRRAADAIGRRVATQEAFERAVGGPDNARRIEQSYQGASTEQRQQDAPQIDRQGNAERLANVIEMGTFALGGAGIARSLLARGARALGARLGIGGARGAAATFTVDAKIASQMAKRGWNNQSMRETIESPARRVATRDTRHNPAAAGGRNNEPATAFVNRDGSYVVRNDRTGQIVQVSNRNDPNWISPF